MIGNSEPISTKGGFVSGDYCGSANSAKNSFTSAVKIAPIPKGGLDALCEKIAVYVVVEFFAP
jgi:hypothetical protein